MLTITRVPTVMLLEQMSQSTDDLKSVYGASKLMNSESLPGALMPLYKCAQRIPVALRKRVCSFGDLQSVPDILDYNSTDSADSSSDEDSMNSKSLFDMILLAQWDKMSTEGMFRYDVTECSTKMIPGRIGFLAQLNEGRALKKRPTEFRVDLVKQDFDPSKFNFTKAAQKEALFQLDTASATRTYLRDAKVLDDSPHLVVINVSPIEYGHVLLVPRVLDNLPQQIQPHLLQVAIEMVAESANPFFRAGYNSLGAYATINHLHFQAYYMMAPFPIERATSVRLGRKRKTSVIVSRLTDYPVRALVFESATDPAELAALCGDACVKLQDSNIPFNLLIVDGGARVFVIPQCYAEKQARELVEEKYLDTQVNPACFEICGHMVLKRQEDYDNFTEAFTCDLLSQVSLSEERFQSVIDMIGF